MQKKHSRFHIGLRTVKTAAAVVISMIIVDALGTSSSKLIFAMLGAMAAVQPSFHDSVESCLTQIIGVLFGAAVGLLLDLLPIHYLLAVNIGIIMVITLYNALRLRYPPGIPCFIVVLICTTPDIEPLSYALTRIWDTAIGLGVGMLINTLIFPYDNSRQIRFTMESLDRELVNFLEDMFDGDDKLPDADEMSKKIDGMSQQLRIFANQRIILHMKRRKEQLAAFREYEHKARRLIAHMEVLCRMGMPGALSEENRALLKNCGAAIKAKQAARVGNEKDCVTNYHVAELLTLRRELLEVLGK